MPTLNNATPLHFATLPSFSFHTNSMAFDFQFGTRHMWECGMEPRSASQVRNTPIPP